MNLMELIANLPITVDSAELPAVGGITHDSRRVEEGDLFVALAGEHHDGRSFAPEASRRGAAAVLGAG
jgi:UDP-N-acetylmuramoyl-L-alanyl-D-glutamate--2,6-diaminopimelate ligase